MLHWQLISTRQIPSVFGCVSGQKTRLAENICLGAKIPLGTLRSPPSSFARYFSTALKSIRRQKDLHYITLLPVCSRFSAADCCSALFHLLDGDQPVGVFPAKTFLCVCVFDCVCETKDFVKTRLKVEPLHFWLRLDETQQIQVLSRLSVERVDGRLDWHYLFFLLTLLSACSSTHPNDSLRASAVAQEVMLCSLTLHGTFLLISHH